VAAVDQGAAIDAAKAAQTYMGLVLKQPVKAWGHWGSYTHGLYMKLVPAQKAAVDQIVATFGLNVDDLRATALLSKAQVATDTDNQQGASALIGKRYFTNGMMIPIILDVSRQSGVSSDVLQKFLDLEARVVKIGGVNHYDAWAVNSGGYRGLFQFDQGGAAWAGARRALPILPPFSDAAWKDPKANVLAGAGYLLYNTGEIRRLGYKGPVTSNIAYLMHNQGARGAFEILRGSRTLRGSQSIQANLVAQAAIKDANLTA